MEHVICALACVENIAIAPAIPIPTTKPKDFIANLLISRPCGGVIDSTAPAGVIRALFHNSIRNILRAP
jgi:hypothetical protein